MTGRRPAQPLSPGELAVEIATAKAEARAAGLTDADIDAELAATNAEHWSASPPVANASTGLAAEFRVFRRGRTLGGLQPKDLIAEGRDPEPTDGA